MELAECGNDEYWGKTGRENRLNGGHFVALLELEV